MVKTRNHESLQMSLRKQVFSLCALLAVFGPHSAMSQSGASGAVSRELSRVSSSLYSPSLPV